MNARNFYVFKIEFYDTYNESDEIEKECGLVPVDSYSEVAAFLEKRFPSDYFEIVSISISSTEEMNYIPVNEKVYNTYVSNHGVCSTSDLTPDQFFE